MSVKQNSVTRFAEDAIQMEFLAVLREIVRQEQIERDYHEGDWDDTWALIEENEK